MSRGWTASVGPFPGQRYIRCLTLSLTSQNQQRRQTGIYDILRENWLRTGCKQVVNSRCTQFVIASPNPSIICSSIQSFRPDPSADNPNDAQTDGSGVCVSGLYTKIGLCLAPLRRGNDNYRSGEAIHYTPDSTEGVSVRSTVSLTATWIF